MHEVEGFGPAWQLQAIQQRKKEEIRRDQDMKVFTMGARCRLEAYTRTGMRLNGMVRATCAPWICELQSRRLQAARGRQPHTSVVHGAAP